jgi:hypothetical protein
VAEILIFKTPQAKDDFWASLETQVKGWWRSGEWDQNCLPLIVDRFHRIFNLALARLPEASFRLDPVVGLTPEELSGLKKQVEAQFSEQVYPEFIAQILLSVLCELGEMEVELFRLRQKTELGSPKQPRLVTQHWPGILG